MKKVVLLGPGLIFFAAILWGLDGVLRRSLFSLEPIVIVFYEHLIGALIIAPFFWFAFKREREGGVKFSRQDWLVIGLLALLSGVLGTLFFTTALAKVNFIPFSVVFLLQKLQPIFAIATAAILLKEKITRKYLVWAGLALVAAYFVTFPGGVVNFGQVGIGTLIAVLFAVGAAVAWGTSTAFSRHFLARHSNTVAVGMRFFLTVPLAFLVMLALGSAEGLGAVGGSQFVRLLIIALSTGMVALWIYYRGLKITQAKISTILELAFPLTAVIVDIFLYDTFLAPSQYLAAVVLLFAIYKVGRLNRETD